MRGTEARGGRAERISPRPEAGVLVGGAGKLGSTNASVIFLGQVLGLAASGAMAEMVGIRTVFFLCAALAVTLAVAGKVFLQQTR